MRTRNPTMSKVGRGTNFDLAPFLRFLLCKRLQKKVSSLWRRLAGRALFTETFPLLCFLTVVVMAQDEDGGEEMAQPQQLRVPFGLHQ